MKQLLLIIFLSTLCLWLQAQVEAGGGFYRSHTGLNYRVGVDYYWDRFTIGGGIKYLKWKNTNFNDSLYADKLRPLSQKERFGFYLNFQYLLWQPNPKVKLGTYYDFSFTHASVVNQKFRFSHVGYIPSVGNDTIIWMPIDFYYSDKQIYKPATGLEHYIGLCLEATIFKRFVLSQRAGLGITQYIGLDPAMTLNNATLEFSGAYGVTLKYRFGKRKETNISK